MNEDEIIGDVIKQKKISEATTAVVRCVLFRKNNYVNRLRDGFKNVRTKKKMDHLEVY